MQPSAARKSSVFESPRENPVIRIFTMMLDFKQAYSGAEAKLSDEDQKEGTRISGLPTEEQTWALNKWNIKTIKEGESEKDRQLKEEEVAHTRTRVKLEFELAESKQQTKDAMKMARIDTLTGVYSRRFLEEYLPGELNKIARNQNDTHNPNKHVTMSILMLDIDHFKMVNDTLGHKMGDAALKEFAAILRHNIRGYDTITRWGGEEFIITLDASPEDCLKKAEVIREEVEKQLKLLLKEQCQTEEEEKKVDALDGTVSIGMASHSSNDTPLTSDEFVNQADNAMYHSKKTGRNKVTVFDPKTTLR
jgi:diguanylate cyclase (GGDEF)-like protein